MPAIEIAILSMSIMCFGLSVKKGVGSLKGKGMGLIQVADTAKTHTLLIVSLFDDLGDGVNACIGQAATLFAVWRYGDKAVQVQSLHGGLHGGRFDQFAN